MRFATYELAQKFAVEGTVENLDDGRVKIIAEGPLEEVDRFVDAVRNIATGKIKDIARFDSEPSHEFDCFSVRR
jgi:acylphosphatase